MILLVILTVLGIAVPGMACGGTTPTPTPTPAPTPTPPIFPPGGFACPDTSYPLLTADGETAGCAAVSNAWDATSTENTLNVTFWMAGSFSLKEADVSGTIPIVIPRSAQSFASPTQSCSFLIPLGDTGDVADLIINLHAVVQNKNTGGCSWVFSDGTETYKAYSNPKLGPDSAGTPLTRSGTAALAWAPNADSSLYLGNPSSRFAFSYAKWIWESYHPLDPWKGDIVDFTKTFTLDGTPVSGTLWITADDGFEVSLNGGVIGNHGLVPGWRTPGSDLKATYVPGHGIWESVGKYDLMQAGNLQQGANTLVIETANRYMGPDNGDTDKGTIWTNVGALKYEARICTSSPGKDAWVDGKSIDYIIRG